MPIVIIAAAGTFFLATAFVVTGALLSGDSYRPARRKTDVPPGEAAAPRPANARTRATDRLPDRLPAAPNLPMPPPVEAPPLVPSSAPPASPKVDDVAAALLQSGVGRSIAVVGGARNVGTTLTAIALARALSRGARVVLVDLAFVSPNIDVISSEPSAPGLADLVRGRASFGDIITRDRVSHAHVVAAGQVGGDAAGLMQSQMLWAAVGALSQSYDFLVLDGGSQSDIALAPLAQVAPHAILVGGEMPAQSLAALAGQLQSAGFAEVTALSGPPPALEELAAQSAA
jgi:Mrp family chromosome partitioning ATPase